MSTTTIADHGYVPEEHAPDPVTSHGDPTAPGKVGIWLFLASEIMFFIGILGSYIILRSGSPILFAEHAAALNKVLAGINTLVLIFSSLTMALAVDAAARRQRGRLIGCLVATLLCACGFMLIKYFEYSDKFHHYTFLAKTDSPLTVKAAPSQTLYAVLSSTTSSSSPLFTGSAYERQAGGAAARAELWKRAAIPLAETPPGSGNYTATIPAAGAGRPNVRVYAKQSAEPTSKDTLLKKDVEANYGGGIWVYDGHLHDHGPDAYAFDGYRRPYPEGKEGVNINLVSEHSVKAASGQDKPVQLEIRKDLVTTQINYGPWKNIFYASYFTLTGIHGLHVIGGIIPMVILLIQALRGKIFPAQTEYTGLYWHFVDLVWIFLFPLLYLI